MSTRAVIARETDKGWEGRYHHFDGYPSGLGKALFDLYNGYFGHDLAKMLKVLLDDHPAGWSDIVGRNFRKAPGFVEDTSKWKDEDRPLCYCHGDRHEEAQLLTRENASACGVEYAYVFSGAAITILSSYCADGHKMIGMFGMGDENATWREVAMLDLNSQEPDWEVIK